ncbi:hypothetical protein Gasu2_34140 [Galdieria sulphuraria]|nr:hypothetical protein Gasu2_34140 [Galdieria sulphuraria]
MSCFTQINLKKRGSAFVSCSIRQKFSYVYEKFPMRRLWFPCFHLASFLRTCVPAMCTAEKNEGKVKSSLSRKPLVPFKVVKQIFKEVLPPHVGVSLGAIQSLQLAGEEYLRDMFRESSKISAIANRTTVYVEDLKLNRRFFHRK